MAKEDYERIRRHGGRSGRNHRLAEMGYSRPCYAPHDGAGERVTYQVLEEAGGYVVYRVTLHAGYVDRRRLVSRHAEERDADRVVLALLGEEVY